MEAMDTNITHESNFSKNGGRVCAWCIGEDFLSTKIQQEGEEETCSYCGMNWKTITVDQIAVHIETAVSLIL